MFNILDIALIVVVVIGLCVGLAKGFAKLFNKAICLILALGGSVIATIILAKILKTTPLFAKIHGVATGWFSKSLYTTPVATVQQLMDMFSGEDVGVMSVLSGLSAKIFGWMTSVGVNTLGGYFGYLIAMAIVAFVLWLLSYLILKYLLLGIKKLLALAAKAPVLRSIDKIFGSILTLAVTYVIVIGLLYTSFLVICVKFVPNWLPKVETLVQGSMLFRYVHHTNFIGQFLGNLLKVDISALF